MSQNMKHIFVQGFSIFLLSMVAMHAMANEQSGSSVINTPTTMLEAVSKKTFEALKSKKNLIENDPGALKEIIEKELFPYIDEARMARWALGKNWRKATKEQRIAFAHEFETLLLRTYSTALLKYIDATIEFFPVKLVPGNRQAIVRSQVRVASNPQPIAINYRLYLGNNQWRIFDISIEDVSLIASYRTTFTREVRNRGIDGLIESLVERNKSKDKESS